MRPKDRLGRRGSYAILELRRKGGCGLGLQQAEGNSHGDRKARVWKITVCWATFSNGTQRGL